jgi:DNA-binding response OmpR family regulator
MKVLYLNLDRDLIGAPEFLRAENYEVIEVSSFRGALELIEEAEGLDAVLVDNGNPETADFIAHVHRVRPYVPVFVVSAWGADLVLALQSLATAAHASTIC